MDKSFPKISIVTVCRNSLELLKRTVDSVAALTYPYLEYIVIDGASTDGTVDYLQLHRNQIDILISEPDGGIYDAMNKGVAKATGDFVVFMNAGDSFASNDIIEQILPLFKEACVVYGSVIKDGKVKIANAPKNFHRMFFCHQSAFALRDALLEFPFDTSYKMSADFKHFKQLYKAGYKFVKADMPISIFDMTGISNKKRSSGILENIKVIKEIDSFRDRLKFLPRLYYVYLLLKIRGK